MERSSSLVSQLFSEYMQATHMFILANYGLLFFYMHNATSLDSLTSKTYLMTSFPPKRSSVRIE